MWGKGGEMGDGLLVKREIPPRLIKSFYLAVTDTY